MVKQKKFKYLLLVVLIAGTMRFAAQSPYQPQVSVASQQCGKAGATLLLSGLHAQDVVTISWSSGQTQLYAISGLEEGEYSVQVIIKRSEDTVTTTQLDTLIAFTVVKAECKVFVGNQFTPNGDGYNDALGIGNIDSYPNFELDIFDRWGQLIHSQKGKYTPWDGTWAGVKVPDGVYYYVLFYDAANKSKLLKGSITLLR